MRAEPAVGLQHERRLTVRAKHTVPRFYASVIPLPDMPEVLATAWLVVLVEGTAAELLLPYLDESEATVGRMVSIVHLAPTPPGVAVRVRVVLDEVDGRQFRFRAECFDDRQLVATAQHERILVDKARFADRAVRRSSSRMIAEPEASTTAKRQRA